MKIMLIGKTGCGKTTLTQILNNKKIEYQKTQAVVFDNKVIDTPGEYLENRSYYKALNVTSMEADIIIFLQSADDSQNLYPPNFSNMFSGKKVIGLITKIDLNSDTKEIENLLSLAGAEKIFKADLISKTGIDELKNYLEV